jgi:L-alanine-DL-glutamate epimerase-like enolase superfamily enzyme
MKITDLRCTALRAPISDPVRLSFATSSERRAMLVHISTDAGIEGLGETWVNYPAWAIEERLATMIHGIKPLVLGRDPLEIEAIQTHVLKSLLTQGRQWGAVGIIYQALAGLDMALHDLLGKASGQPVAELLGGSADTRVPVYASGLHTGITEAEVNAMLERGFRAFKVRVGFDLECDLEALQRIRSWLGADTPLMVDANQAWTFVQAQHFVAASAGLDLQWIEEPLHADDLNGLTALKHTHGATIAAGENWYGPQFAQALHDNAVDVVQPDLAKNGGIHLSRPVIRAALAQGKTYALHCFSGAVMHTASLHLFAAEPRGRFVEVDATTNPLLNEVLLEPLQLEAGFMRLPDGPGLGIRCDPVMLERFTVAIA